jgi:hypothetical protein
VEGFHAGCRQARRGVDDAAPGAGRADRAPFGGTDTTGLLRLAERDVYLCHAASNGPDASVRPGKSPARLDRPYTCEIPDGSRPDRDAVPRVALRSTSLPLEAPGLGADDAFVGAGEHWPNRAVHGPTDVVWAEALEGVTEATGPRLDPRDGALPMWPAGRGGRGLSSDQPVRWARPGSRDCYLRVTEISGNRRSSDRRRLSPASMARPRPDGRRANAGGRATTRSTRKAARLRSVRCRSAS